MINAKNILGAGVLAVAAALPAQAQRDFSKVEIKTTKIADGLYMLVGAGGNLGLSVGDDGAFLIDDQFAPLSEKIAAAVADVSDQPVAFVVNTHWHGDHTGGNESFGESGAHIVAHKNVRKRLKEGMNAGGRNTPPAPDAALPVITFTSAITFHWNGEKISITHPKDAHTDGDAFVFFKTANALHMGDIFFNGGFPFVDLASGGDLDGYIAAQEQALGMVDEDTKIIPGHGPLASKADLAKSVAMLKDVRSRIQALLDAGKSEDEIVAAAPLADLDPIWGQGFINGERMTRAAVQSLSKD